MPPYVPPDEPPSFTAPTLSFEASGGTNSDHTDIDVNYYLSVQMGSAKNLFVKPKVSITDCEYEVVDSVTHAFTADDTVEGSFLVILLGYFDPESMPVTVTMTGDYTQDGQPKTVTASTTLSLYEYP